MRTIPSPRTAAAPNVGSERTVLTDAIIAQFRSALHELRCLSGDRMRKTELSYTTIHILSMLDRHGEMPMSRLADMLDVSLSNASGIIDRLEDRALVERFRVPDDRRVVMVRTTTEGRAALARAEVFKDDLLAKILERLDDAGLDRLAAALGDVAEAAADVFATDPDLARHEHVA
jgi:DNA-binding MarR family transcriptional regulator